MTTCDQCPMREQCTELCPEMERQLPHPDGGLERLLPHRSERYLRRFVREKAIADAMRANEHLLTAAQARVSRLFYHDGLPQSEIATRLSMRENSVWDSLRSARRKIGKHLIRNQKRAV